MASSITFDFISRGGPALAADFKRTGDNAAAAARGAKVLSDVIKDLGQKEDRTAAESATLARALKLTGDAEDRAAAKALAADIAIRRLDDSLKDSGKNAGGAKGGFLGLAGEITGFGSAADAATSGGSKFKLALAGLNLATGIAEPVVAALGVAVGAVAAGAVAAGIGLGGFSAVAQSQIAPVTKAMQDQAAAVKGGAAAQKTYKADLAALTPVQRELLTSLTGVKNEFDAWSASLARPVLTPILAALKLVNPLLKDMSPFVLAAASAIGVLVGKLSAAVNSTGFQQWLQTMLPLVKPVIVDIGTAIGNVVVGIGGMLAAFAPFTTEVLGGLDALTKKFAAWGTTLSSHSGFNAMIAEFRQNWPLVRTGLGELATIVKNILSAMAGLATGANSKALWEVANPLLALVAGLSSHPAVVRDLLYLLAAIQLAQKAGGVVSLGVKVAGAGQKLLDFFKTGTLTIGAAGMQTAGDTMTAAAAAMQRAADTMVGADAAAGKGGAAAGGAEAAGGGAAAKGAAAGGGAAAGAAALGVAAAGAFAGALIKAVGDTLSPSGTFAGKLNKMFQGLSGPVSASVLHAFTFGGLEAWVTAKIGEPVGAALNATGKFIQNTWATIWSNTVSGAVNDGKRLVAAVSSTWSSVAAGARQWWANITTTITGFWGNLRSGAVLAFNQVKTSIASAWSAVWANTRAVVGAGVAWVAGTWNTLKAGVVAAYNAVKADIAGAWSAIWTNTRAVVGAGVAAVAGLWNTLKAGVVAAYNTVKANIASAWSAIWANTRSAVTAGIANVASFFAGLPGKVTAALGAAGKLLVSWGSGVINGLLSGVKSVWQSVVNFFLTVPKAILNALGIKSPPDWAIEAGKNIMTGLGIGVSFAKGVVSKATAAQIQAAATAGIAGPGGGAPAANAALARKLMPAWGSGAEWAAWNALEMSEAGWNQFARNPSSGAYGIPQALPPSKMGAAANPPQSNPTAQINWMIGYIKSVYGDPIRAEQHEIANHWYDQGGWLMPGLTLAHNTTGRPEQVLPPGRGGDGAAAGGPAVTDRLDRLALLLERLIGTTAAVPAATGRHVGGAIGGAAASASFRSRYPRGGA